MHLVKTYGLRRLKELLETSNALPLFIQQLMLTFACTDFEEIKPTSKFCIGELSIIRLHTT